MVRHRIARLLPVAAVSAGVLLVVAELALRIFAPIDDALYGPDEILIYAPRPQAHRTFERSARNGGGTVEVRFNSRGFRGPEISAAPGKRVVVYGDSFIEADATRERDTFTVRLQERLASRLGEDVEVINAGVAGYGPDQEGLRMQRELPLLAPDLLVLAIYAGNDFGDLLRNRIFRLDEKGELVYEPKPLADGHARWLRRTAGGWDAYALQLTLRAERAWHVVRDGMRNGPHGRPYDVAESLRVARKEYEDAVLDPKPVVLELFDDHYDADVALEPDAASSRYKRALFVRVLSWIRARAEAAGRPIVLLVLPPAVDACRGYDASIDLYRYPHYEASRLSDVVADVARDAGIPFLSLWEPFRGGAADCRYYHSGEDNHWNEAGQERAAQLVDEFLAAQGLPR